MQGMRPLSSISIRHFSDRRELNRDSARGGASSTTWMEFAAKQFRSEDSQRRKCCRELFADTGSRSDRNADKGFRLV
jgi:hypothetical protein